MSSASYDTSLRIGLLLQKYRIAYGRSWITEHREQATQDVFQLSIGDSGPLAQLDNAHTTTAPSRSTTPQPTRSTQPLAGNFPSGHVLDKARAVP